MKYCKYTIKLTDGRTVNLTVPEKWKLTFAPLFPGKAVTYPNYGGAIRIYKGVNKLKAIIPNVKYMIAADEIGMIIDGAEIPEFPTPQPHYANTFGEYVTTVGTANGNTF